MIGAATDGAVAIYTSTEDESDCNGWIGSAHDLVEIESAFAYFAGLPAAPAQTHARMSWLTSDGAQLMTRLGANCGLSPFAIGADRHPGLLSRRKLHSAADVRCRKIATRGLMRDVYRALGAISSEPSVNPVDNHSSFDFYEAVTDGFAIAQQAWIRYDKLTPATELTVLVITNAAWRSRDMQAAIAGAAARAVAQSSAAQTALSVAARPPPQDLLDEMRGVTAAIIADIATRGLLVNTVDRSYRRAMSGSG
jgi:hypothetical protein